MSNLEETYVSIKLSEYTELMDDSHFLNCLRNAGVDNWDGYDYAIEEYEEQSKGD